MRQDPAGVIKIRRESYRIRHKGKKAKKAKKAAEH
jgi:hypothetical protein